MSIEILILRVVFASMPRRIPDYPDAFYMFNKIASWGSYVSGVSL
jgi:heme/copper-type cytochrome/quinol oxidase subunit 1